MYAGNLRYSGDAQGTAAAIRRSDCELIAENLEFLALPFNVPSHILRLLVYAGRGRTATQRSKRWREAGFTPFTGTESG